MMNEPSITTTIDGTSVVVPPNLIAKYNRSLPRYTSYPTAPVWSDTIGVPEYENALAHVPASGLGDQPISLYVHLPFCAARCTFCGCHAIVTSKRDAIDTYLATLERELALVASKIKGRATIAQLHWGGGTPNYLDNAEIRRCMTAILRHFDIAPDVEASIELDPRWTNPKQLALLRVMGFNRVSFGVQDTIPTVQEAIGRIHTMDDVTAILTAARETGFKSVNIDLMYGLPFQTQTTWEQTLRDVEHLRPDRIALFGFAYVPWLKPNQRRVEPTALPTPLQRLQLFTTAIERFGKLGYTFIGLDHFARHDDELAIAQRAGTLHRNFQGYSTRSGLDLIGVGLSSIGFLGHSYFQNDAKLVTYERRITSGELATTRGYRLSQDDKIRRRAIGQIFCHQRLRLDDSLADTFPNLQDLAGDGLIQIKGQDVTVTPLGRLFIRAVAAAFDQYLTEKPIQYSQAV
ncbi:MAG: oxygen-independent coproporphyrinogen III oxidase [Deltaproteobacteria bacterium]|nr:oxygen-independent coproporphyrinogen III oxidase [Deltaproteobacteria bacterium]